MCVFSDTQLVHGKATLHTLLLFFSPSLNAAEVLFLFSPSLIAAEAQALRTRVQMGMIRRLGKVGMTASAVLTPAKRPFTVGNPLRRLLVFTNSGFSSDHINELILRGTVQQHGVTLTGVLQPRDGCQEARRGATEDDFTRGDS